MMRVDTGTVGHDVGRIVQAISLMPAVSMVVAAVNGEFYAVPAFAVSAVVHTYSSNKYQLGEMDRPV